MDTKQENITLDTQKGRLHAFAQYIINSGNHPEIKNISNFEKHAGLSNGTMGKDNRDISIGKTFQPVTKAFPDLNPIWLLTGHGEMLKSMEEDKAITKKNKSKDKQGDENILAEPAEEYVTQKHENQRGIPMYNLPASASNVEMYQDLRDVKIIGHLNIPGAVKGSFALPVYGHSMYPTLENGNWCVLRPLSDPTDIDYGEVFYLEYGDYRVFKRLIQVEDEPESVVLWSDNQTELVNGKPKYSAKKINVGRIKRLCLLTEVLRKPNY